MNLPEIPLQFVYFFDIIPQYHILLISRTEFIMRYRFLLFDVDNTLLDFDANEAESFRSMIEQVGETWTQELYETYRQMNINLWKQIERKEISVEEGINRRFSDLMVLYGKCVDGKKWEEIYRFYLNQGAQKIPQVDLVLQNLKKQGYELYVITNGVEETQVSRMKKSGLDQYFRESFISGKVGIGKPSKEFFDYVKLHIDGFEEYSALIIGDSLTSDIKGGIDNGIDTCWFYRDKKKELWEEELKESGLQPTYKIRKLTELLTILSH